MEKRQHRADDGSATLTSAHPTVLAPNHTAPVHESKRDYSYYKAVFKGHPMPLAYLDLDLLDSNIAAILAYANGKQIRAAPNFGSSVTASFRCSAPCSSAQSSSPWFSHQHNLP